MKLFYLFIVLFVLFFLLLVQLEWDIIVFLLNNLVIDYFYVFVLDGKGYFVVGVDEFSYLDIFFQYDFEVDIWIELDDFFGGFWGFGIGDIWDGKVYFGFGFSGLFYMCDFWVFDF